MIKRRDGRPDPHEVERVDRHRYALLLSATYLYSDAAVKDPYASVALAMLLLQTVDEMKEGETP